MELGLLAGISSNSLGFLCRADTSVLIAIDNINRLSDEPPVTYHVFLLAVQLQDFILVVCEGEVGCPVPVLGLHVDSIQLYLNTRVANLTDVTPDGASRATHL